MLTFGSDPEFLIINEKNEVKSAISVVGGTEDAPIEHNGEKYYYDNVLAECTVKPGKNKKEFTDNIKAAIQQYSKIVSPWILDARAAAEFPDEELYHPDSRVAGCAPDNCAYTMQMKRPPKDAFSKNNLRTCGGHIHLGENYAVKNEEGPEPIFCIYMLDLFVGIPSLFLDNDPTSITRRKIYGQAGRYRKKEYGVEYRSLGNFWLKSPKFVSLIHDLCSFAVDFVESGKVSEYWSFDEDLFYEADDLSEAFQCKGYDTEMLRQAIDTSDRKAAKPFLKLAKSHLPSNLSRAITTLSKMRHKLLYEEWGL